MLRHALVAIVFSLLAACGSKQQAPEPAPAPTGGDGAELPAPEPGPAAEMSEEECIAAGGMARWDIGDGNVQCEAGEEEIARIPVGIEGGICCKPAAAAE